MITSLEAYQDSPLDLNKQCIEIIGGLSVEFAEAGTSIERRKQILGSIAGLTSMIPVLNQEVFVCGTELESHQPMVLVEDKDGLKAGSIIEPCLVPKNPPPDSDEVYVVKGIFRGFSVETVLDSDGQRKERVLLMLETGRDVFRSSTLQTVNVVSHAWFSVDTDLAFLPVEPVNTHSLKDLENTEAKSVIDKILSKPVEPNDLRLEMIAEYLDRLMQSGSVIPFINQLVSYVNASAVVSGYDILARDFIENIPAINHNLYEYTLSTLSTTAHRFTASHLVALRSYKRTGPGPGDFIVNPYNRVYVRARSVDGIWVTIPAKEIIEFGTMPKV